VHKNIDVYRTWRTAARGLIFMNVLILGSGGREHALAHAISKSRKLTHLYNLPGNAGTAVLGTNVPGDPGDIEATMKKAKDLRIDLTVVGPEAPLCAGIVDAFYEQGLKVFGPTKDAARIEGDKAYAKQLMRRALVPTAEARIFDDFEAAKTYVATRDSALVVKASGLAAGKGVIVCDDPADALLALERIMLEKEFGDAGKTVIVEEKLAGPEISALALVDDTTIYILETARDHKRIGDGDTGPNTGGMGACSPAPGATDDLLDRVQSEIFVPIVDAMRGEGITYRGVLYAGLMLTAAGPKVLEFNCRFGDPETQVILPRIRSDVLELLDACANGRLADAEIDWDPRAAVCVVMSAAGYPGSYKKGQPITGLEDAAALADVTVFQAGTARIDKKIVTHGGRVLGVTGLGSDTNVARAKAYQGVERIRFEGAYYRKDVAV
jgi:phosphoribosylamine--glycine ligase